MPPLDTLGRPLRSLRISVTDRCNLRCHYCMPEAEYTWLPREDVLSFEEIAALVGVFTAVGVRRVRLTGGEPLLRRDLPRLVERLAANPDIEDLALTTNGVLLAAHARALRAAGLHRVTVSLDTLDRRRFVRLARADALAAVLDGLAAAREAGLTPLKIDTVLVRGINDDEIVDLLEFGRTAGAEVRFIEYMDVGGATRWSPDLVVTRREVLERIAAHYGPVRPVPGDPSAPADRFALPDGTIFGVVSSVTEPFCRDCDRSRLTADGIWFLCLYARSGVDLRGPLRAGWDRAALAALVERTWRARRDRGAEERLGLRVRAPLVPREALRRDAHLEMHTRGG
ncbi:MAG TPA: GTP 3',8-cyclase MoaA [Vicinamibacterales bacterium]|nr:GTP 3',8-cyclase MoaA [Vicinamibacterales bacterium]